MKTAKLKIPPHAIQTYFKLVIKSINYVKKIVFIAFVVSLGGFLFGFDAGIISGVMSYAGPEFNLSDGQTGWVVSSPSFAAMIAMLISGRLSDVIGRKKILILLRFYMQFLHCFCLCNFL